MPTVSALGIQISYLIGALVTVELLFNYQGLGYLLLEASLDKDVPMLQAASMVTAVVYMLCILGSDIAYGVLDPRVRYSEAAT
jgi:peptide/nickel transport system permease protein